jgi:hypothetical protein
MTANRIAKVERESRFREIIVALLVVEFGALCIALAVNGKEPNKVSTGSDSDRVSINARSRDPGPRRYRSRY